MALGFVASRGLPKFQENFLRGFFGLFPVFKEPVGQRKHECLMKADKFREGEVVALSGQFHEAVIAGRVSLIRVHAMVDVRRKT